MFDTNSFFYSYIKIYSFVNTFVSVWHTYLMCYSVGCVLCSLFNIYVVLYTPPCELCYFILILRFIYKFKGKHRKERMKKKKNHNHSQCSFGVCYKRKSIKFRINNEPHYDWKFVWIKHSCTLWGGCVWCQVLKSIV